MYSIKHAFVCRKNALKYLLFFINLIKILLPKWYLFYLLWVFIYGKWINLINDLGFQRSEMNLFHYIYMVYKPFVAPHLVYSRKYSRNFTACKFHTLSPCFIILFTFDAHVFYNIELAFKFTVMLNIHTKLEVVHLLHWWKISASWKLILISPISCIFIY